MFLKEDAKITNECTVLLKDVPEVEWLTAKTNVSYKKNIFKNIHGKKQNILHTVSLEIQYGYYFEHFKSIKLPV